MHAPTTTVPLPLILVILPAGLLAVLAIRRARAAYVHLLALTLLPGRRYDGNRRWRVIRTWVIERDKGECRLCMSREGLHVHHRRPVSAGGSHRPGNLITLCDVCHRWHHRR